jgi:hypothetical protein
MPQSLANGSRAIRKLTIDYEPFVRIISTRAVIRALRQVTDASSGAVAAAAEFQTRVGQIRTISGDLASKEIANSVRDLNAAILIGQRDTGRYTDDLGQISRAGKKLNDEKAKLVIETDAQKAAAELNKSRSQRSFQVAQSRLSLQ